jgi:hypothetical protein
VARRSSDNDDKTEHEKDVSTEATAAEDTENASTDTDPAKEAPGPEAREADTDETAEIAEDTDVTDGGAVDTRGHDPESPATEGETDGFDAHAETGADAESRTDTAPDTGTGTGKTDLEDAVEVEAQSEPETNAEQAPPADIAREAQATPPTTVVEKRGPGFVPLVLGGIVAAGLGYFASVAELIPGLGDPGPSPELQTALDQQADALAALRAELAALGESQTPSVDLGPVTDEIATLSSQIDETAAAITALADRVVTLEERPVFSGEVTADAAEASEAVAALEERMRQREEAAAARAAEAEAAAQAARDAAAQAQAEAEAAAARAQAEAALNALRLSVTRGEPFADPLQAVAAVTEVPDALNAAADSGVPSLEALQNRFPAAARAALPVALRETAGDSPVDRFGAFLRGQVGGRAVAPREGDDPDAILSRAQGAVTAGDLDAALAEIATLPEAAQAELADWTADARARSDVLSALETVTQALAGAN